MANEDLKEALIRTEARAKSNSHRIERLEAETAAITRIAIAVEVLAGEQKNMNEKLSEVGEKVTELEKMPVRRYDALLGYIATAVGSLLAGLLLAFLAG